ncbi:hypothetical protein K469DRAFT_753464 [Zopfia rhizophila CBS 207.26]|uniref:C2H2-type domain-containing protein n=1 Tax=Zopfia rhizophila CBS 207.26 TaxID=1314779 RepID=A0A6A6DML0_9PEZI|nr:hypothetical protein K469DRAFT_753464 [Zopfia rhizophila CBS 207.26]
MEEQVPGKYQSEEFDMNREVTLDKRLLPYPEEGSYVLPTTSSNQDAIAAWINQHVEGNGALEYNTFCSDNQQSIGTQYQYQEHQQQQVTTSTRSSLSSNSRYSGVSSNLPWRHARDSTASTSTNWTSTSNISRDTYAFQPGRSSWSDSLQQADRNTLESMQTFEQNQAFQHPANPVDSQFSTCVSRPKRCPKPNAKHSYWCTACGEGFREKFDWKRHEETYQERSEKYRCENCSKTFFLGKDFKKHHEDSHKCQTCKENQHVEKSREKLRTRTAWGCGFCGRADTNWTQRWHHVASHFEEGQTMDEWKHSNVIFGLLSQPYVRDEWARLLVSKHEQKLYFGWNQHTTGRSEGYPGSNRPPQLQDLLEFFVPGQNARALAEFAYKKGHRRPADPLDCSTKSQSILGVAPLDSPAASRDKDYSNQLSQSSRSISLQYMSTFQNRATHPSHGALLNKKLPPVPPMQDRSVSLVGTSYDTLHVQLEPWDNLINTISEDHVLPDSFATELDDIDFNNSTQDSDYDLVL